MKMSNKVYDVLKYIALIVLPALAALYSGIAKIWNLPYEVAIPATIMVVDTFLGALLQLSTAQYNKTQQIQPPDEEEQLENS